MKKYVIFLTLFISGCNTVSPQQQCQNLGFDPGTDEFRQCTMSVYQQRQQALQGLYMSNLQNQQMQQQQNANMIQGLNAAAANSIRRPVQTNCSPVGNSINCTSY